MKTFAKFAVVGFGGYLLGVAHYKYKLLRLVKGNTKKRNVKVKSSKKKSK